MELLIDKEGKLVDKEGNPFMAGEEPIIVTNAKTQEAIDKVISERLARQKDRLATLESIATKTPELERMILDLRTEKEKMETELKNAKQSAEESVASTIKALNEKLNLTSSSLENERRAHLRTELTNLILSKSGDVFINATADVVPRLLSVHKREPVLDASGKPIQGKYQDLFEVPTVSEDGEKLEFLPVDKALAALASHPQYQHYVRGAKVGGSGGANYTNTANLRRSAMSDKEKADFIGKHGHTEYMKLPLS